MKKNILLMLILAFIVVIVWIVLKVYQSLHTSTINDTTSVQIQPISPEFDQNEIQDLQNRKAIAPLFQTAPSTTSPTPSITPVVSPTPADLQPTITPPAQSGGGISP